MGVIEIYWVQVSNPVTQIDCVFTNINKIIYIKYKLFQTNSKCEWEEIDFYFLSFVVLKRQQQGWEIIYLFGAK